MLDYVELANTAKQLVAESGREVTFVQFDTTPADADKPWDGPTEARATPDGTLTTIATFVHPSGATSLGLKTLQETMVREAEQIMIVAPGPTVPEDLAMFQEVLDGSLRWKITGVETLRPGAVTLLYFVGVKR